MPTTQRKTRANGEIQPRTTTGYVAQFQWAPPDEPTWIDIQGMHATPEAAQKTSAECLESFNRRKGGTGCIRTGVAGTRIIHRTVTDIPVSRNVPCLSHE